MERKVKAYIVIFLSFYSLILLAIQTRREVLIMPAQCELLDDYPKLFIPTDFAQEDIWLTVKSNKFYIFSAYLDSTEKETVINIVAIGDHTLSTYCQLWTEEDGHWIYYISRAEQYILPNRNPSRLKESILWCKVPEVWRGKWVQYVTVTTRPCELNPNATLVVKDETDTDTKEFSFTVCLSPLYGDFSDITGFIEYVELNQIFGAEYFIVYNASVNDNLQVVMESYREEGILEVVQWNSSVFESTSSVPGIQDYGKAASINDCLYRARMISRYAVFTDIDEYIVPKVNNSWMAVIKTVDMDRNKHFSTYKFRRATFERTWGVRSPYSKNFFIQKYQLNTLLYTRRLPLLGNHSPRCICDTEKVKVAGIYRSPRYVGKVGHTLVHHDLAQLNHYRAWVSEGLLQVLHKISGVQLQYPQLFAKNDHTLLHQGNLLIPRILERLEKLTERSASNNVPRIVYREMIKDTRYWRSWSSLPWFKSVLFY